MNCPPAAAAERTRRRRPRLDELLVDWDEIINKNPSGWSGEHSLVSHVSYPEMDAILGWATHQEEAGGPPSRRSKRARRRCSAASRNTPDQSRGEDHGHEASVSDEGPGPSRLLLPSSSVVMSPPSLLKLLEVKSRTALGPDRYWQIWHDRRWREVLDERDRSTVSAPNPAPLPPLPPPRPAAASSQPQAARVTAPVALGCVLEEAMVERLLPIAQAYVEHCRGNDRAAVGVDGDANDDDNSTSSDVDSQERPEVDVDAWTVSPDQALCALLLDHGVGHLHDEPSMVERRERILAYLERWKGTKTLIESLRI
jgi:hypothetical protein